MERCNTLCSQIHKVWFLDKERKFVQGTISACIHKLLLDHQNSQSHEEFAVVTERGDTLFKSSSELYPSDSEFGFRDNCSLMFLNTPNVLENLTCRFKNALNGDPYGIYTLTGSILLLINPYCSFPFLYDETTLLSYVKKKFSTVNPHPFAIAEAAYSALLKRKESQSIIISGESGSGKTECSKHVLKYLAYNSGCLHDKESPTHLENCVVQTNPILEAFGNATTVRNVNSSRFGKLIKLYFNSCGRIVKGLLSTYLLAKSRVCEVPTLERNYHVFYWLCEDASQQERKEWYLKYPHNYQFLDSQCTTQIPSRLHEVRQAMDALHLGKESRQKDVFKTLSIILTLGNLEFIEGFREGDNVNHVTIINRQSSCGTSNDHLPLDDGTMSALDILHELMGLHTLESQQKFELALTSKKICDSRSNLPVSQAKQTVNALARSIYQRLFDYLVQQINNILNSNETECIDNKLHCSVIDPDGLDVSMEKETGSTEEESHSVGVLDIFGFENMTPYSNNGFEQLCINYANEKLHAFFLEQLIARDAKFYAAEGVQLPEVSMTHSLSSIDCCLSIFNNSGQGPPGIFQLLDEASLAPVVGAKDNFFCQKVNTTLGQNERSSHEPPRSGVFLSKKKFNLTKDFTVRHFSGDVIYVADGFNRQNLDFLSKDLQQCLMLCSNEFLSRVLFCPTNSKPNESFSKRQKVYHEGEKQETGKSEIRSNTQRVQREILIDRYSSSQPKTLASLFCSQVDFLIKSLEQTASWFIRCIKPNNNQTFTQLDQTCVSQQLDAGGMIVALQWLAKGYPCRLSYDELWERYGRFLPESMRSSITTRDFARLLLLILGTSSHDFQLGHSCIFFRFGALQYVDALKDTTDKAAHGSLIQRIYAFWLKCRLKRCFLVTFCTVHFIFFIRHIKAFKIARKAQIYYKTIYQARYRSARLIQCFWKHHKLRQKYTEVMRSKISNLCLSWIHRNRFLKLRTLTISLQSFAKASLTKHHYQFTIHSIEIVQTTAYTKLLHHSFLVYLNSLRRERAACHLQRWWRYRNISKASKVTPQRSSLTPCYSNSITVSEDSPICSPNKDKSSDLYSHDTPYYIADRLSLKPALPLKTPPPPQCLPPPRNSLSQLTPLPTVMEENISDTVISHSDQTISYFSKSFKHPRKSLELKDLYSCTPKIVTRLPPEKLSSGSVLINANTTNLCDNSLQEFCPSTLHRMQDSTAVYHHSESASSVRKSPVIIDSGSANRPSQTYSTRSFRLSRCSIENPSSEHSISSKPCTSAERLTEVKLSQSISRSTRYYETVQSKRSSTSLARHLEHNQKIHHDIKENPTTATQESESLSLSRDVASLIHLPEFQNAVLHVLKEQLLPFNRMHFCPRGVSPDTDHSPPRRPSLRRQTLVGSPQNHGIVSHSLKKSSEEITHTKTSKFTVQRQICIETSHLNQQSQSCHSVAASPRGSKPTISMCSTTLLPQNDKITSNSYIRSNETKNVDEICTRSISKASAVAQDSNLVCQSRRVSWLVMEDAINEKTSPSQHITDAVTEKDVNNNFPVASSLGSSFCSVPDDEGASPLLSFHPQKLANELTSIQTLPQRPSPSRRSIFITDEILLAKKSCESQNNVYSPRQRARLLAQYTTSRIPRLKRIKRALNETHTMDSKNASFQSYSSSKPSLLSSTKSNVFIPSCLQTLHNSTYQEHHNAKNQAIFHDLSTHKTLSSKNQCQSVPSNTIPTLSTVKPIHIDRDTSRPYYASLSKLPRLI